MTHAQKKRRIAVKCDTCGRNTPINIQNERLSDGGVRHYFPCSYCHAQYTIGSITGLGVEFQQRLRQLLSVASLAALLAPGPMVVASFGELSRIREAMEQEVTGSTGGSIA